VDGRTHGLTCKTHFITRVNLIDYFTLNYTEQVETLPLLDSGKGNKIYII